MTGLQRINIFARLIAGQPVAFPLSFEVHLRDATDTAWTPVGTYTTQPLHGVASVALPGVYDTSAIMFRATELSTDPYGNYYLQFLDLEVQK